MKILEWSDTQLTFHITKTEWQTTTDLDLTEFDEVLLIIKFINKTIELTWEIDSQDSSKIVFDLLSEQTQGKAWWIMADIWWIQWAKKLRLNQNTIIWSILASVKVPEWNVNE